MYWENTVSNIKSRQKVKNIIVGNYLSGYYHIRSDVAHHNLSLWFYQYFSYGFNKSMAKRNPETYLWFHMNSRTIHMKWSGNTHFPFFIAPLNCAKYAHKNIWMLAPIFLVFFSEFSFKIIRKRWFRFLLLYMASSWTRPRSFKKLNEVNPYHPNK